MIQQLRSALVVLIALTILTGVAYPLLVTGVAQAIWPHQANGSILQRDGKATGSELIGQSFTDPKYFWPRPSAASPAYNGTGGTGSNMAPTNPALAEVVKSRIAALRAADPNNTSPAPVDLITASASGLDPHITPAAAEYQLARVARARHLNEADVRRLVLRYSEQRDVGVFGEKRVNVLKLNLALDAATATPQL